MKERYSVLRSAYYILWMLVFSVLLAFMNIVFVNKSSTSVSAAFITPVIFFVLFKLVKIPTKTTFVSIQMFTTSCSLAMFGMQIAHASLLIVGSTISIYKVLLISLLMNVGAILFSIPLKDSFHGDRYPFPKAKVTEKLIVAAYSVKTKAKEIVYFFASSIAGAGISLFTSFHHIFQYPLSATGLPSYLGVDVSPMLFGVGMLIDMKTMLSMLVGMLYSTVILLTNATGGVSRTFSEHQQNPLIMSIAMGLIMGGVIHTLPKVAQIFLSFRKKGDTESLQKKILDRDYLLKVLVFVIVSCIVGYYFFGLSVLYWLILLVLGFVFSVGITRIRAETGMGLSVAAYIFIPLVGLMTKNLVTTLIISGSMVLLTLQSANYLESITVARNVHVPSKIVTKYYLIGSIFGSLVGAVILFYLSTLFAFGTESMQSATAMAWGAQAEFVTSGSIPESINFPLIVGATVAGIILTALKLSPSTLAMGLLLPMASISIMCIGAGAARLMKGKANQQAICSGLLLGDGLQFFIRAIISLVH